LPAADDRHPLAGVTHQIADRLRVPFADLKRLNPELLRDFTPAT